MRINYIFGGLRINEFDDDNMGDGIKPTNKIKFYPINYGFLILRAAMSIYKIKKHDYVFKGCKDEISIKLSPKKERQFAKMYITGSIIDEYEYYNSCKKKDIYYYRLNKLFNNINHLFIEYRQMRNK